MLYILHPAPQSGRRLTTPLTISRCSASLNTPSHQSPTPPKETQEHIRRAVRPLSRSLFIKRSERFPHCLLEIPLATSWPKQTLRPANRTYSPHNNNLQSPVGLSLSIIPVCVLSLAQPPLQPRTPTLTHTAAYHPWPRSHYPAIYNGRRRQYSRLYIYTLQ